MPIPIDHKRATDILLETSAAARTPLEGVAATWEPRLLKLSQLCPPRKSATTHAAFATAVLAKCVDARVDVYSLLDRGDTDNSYSARSLADGVLARHRSDLNIDLGANGPNPLNNTPWIGKKSIKDITGVRNKEGWSHFMGLLELLEKVDSTEAREVLKAFIVVRRKSLLAEIDLDETAGEHLTPAGLAAVLAEWVAMDSEEGRRAQACAAAAIDCIFDPRSVEVGMVNDPDRRAPLDVSVSDGEGSFLLACEVKDKPVEAHYVQMSVEKARSKFGVRNIVFLAVHRDQPELDDERLGRWARERGINLTLVSDWSSLILSSSLAFGGTRIFAGAFCERLIARCRDLEVSADGIRSLRSRVQEAEA